jgi:hypothetical protein
MKKNLNGFCDFVGVRVYIETLLDSLVASGELSSVIHPHKSYKHYSIKSLPVVQHNLSSDFWNRFWAAIAAGGIIIGIFASTGMFSEQGLYVTKWITTHFFGMPIK